MTLNELVEIQKKKDLKTVESTPREGLNPFWEHYNQTVMTRQEINIPPIVSSGKLVDVMEQLIETYTLDAVLEAMIKALKRMKNPEHLAFQLYLVAKRALREITKDV